MTSVNVVALSGRIGNDPEIKYWENGDCTVNFSIAVDMYGGKDNEGKSVTKTMWMDCRAYKQRAEFIANHFAKGDKVFVQGQMDFRQWEKEGEKRKAYHINVDQVDKYWPKKEGSDE